MMLTYLGPEGSHSHQVALRLLGQSPFSQWVSDLQAAPSLQALLASPGWGLLPYENALNGSVIESLEGLQDHPGHPVCELQVPIRHSVLVKPGTEPGQIHTVLSHPQALGQCRERIHTVLGPQVLQVPLASTAEAARQVADGPPGLAALGTTTAAKQYGLTVLIEDLSDGPGNMTRFLVLAPQPVQYDGWSEMPVKTSLCLEIPDRPGSLVDVLMLFKLEGLNLSKIESRPARNGHFGQYRFYLDVQADLTAAPYKDFLTYLARHTQQHWVVGPYCNLGILP
jgi:prephenate dehydratase